MSVRLTVCPYVHLPVNHVLWGNVILSAVCLSVMLLMDVVLLIIPLSVHVRNKIKGKNNEKLLE